jgi:hypothetical protein
LVGGTGVLVGGTSVGMATVGGTIVGSTETGVWVGLGVLVGRGVLVGGTGVLVGGTSLGATRVLVGCTRVLIGGADVLVGVGWPGAVEVLVGAGAAAPLVAVGAATGDEVAATLVALGLVVGPVTGPPLFGGGTGESGAGCSGESLPPPLSGAAASLDGAAGESPIAPGLALVAFGRAATPVALGRPGMVADANAKLVGWLVLSSTPVAVGMATIVLARSTNTWAPGTGGAAAVGIPGLFPGERKTCDHGGSAEVGVLSARANGKGISAIL